MRVVRNEDGIALVVSLMFTLISLAMILLLLELVMSASKMTAAQARYKNALEASYGGTEFLTRTVIPRVIDDFTSGSTSLLSDFGGTDKLGLTLPSGAALQQKLTTPTASWTGGTAAKSLNPKELPDVVFNLKGQTGAPDFKVYSKIVDTVPGVGLLDTSGVDYLDPGIGVAGAGASTQSPRTPNIYSIEVQGEKAVNPKEKANLSVLYAY
ncbi:pilus assembly protein PilX [Geomonas sp. RF6]|uniref:pilus assembly protein PilX n=1 Tax=Geomonas sp. RF6 TaxID=2897342 RepID=UPI001E39715D|nr:pilus assembly protein PilX [Geomonas sp. RF6]UFS69642.1 pilus assembly protein PilX [Geomonas sp. RF6]